MYSKPASLMSWLLWSWVYINRYVIELIEEIPYRGGLNFYGACNANPFDSVLFNVCFSIGHL